MLDCEKVMKGLIKELEETFCLQIQNIWIQFWGVSISEL